MFELDAPRPAYAQVRDEMAKDLFLGDSVIGLTVYHIDRARETILLRMAQERPDGSTMGTPSLHRVLPEEVPAAAPADQGQPAEDTAATSIPNSARGNLSPRGFRCIPARIMPY